MIVLCENMSIFAFCSSVLLKYARCKRLKKPQCDIAITGLAHEVPALSKERLQGR